MTSPTAPVPENKILIARFPTRDGAEAAVPRLKSAAVPLGNVAYITKDDAGEVKFTESHDWGIGKSAAVGAVAALILPGIGPILGAAAGALAAYFIDAGFPDALLKQAGNGLLTNNQSALVALIGSGSTETAEQTVMQAGGTVLGSGVEADLARVLDGIRNVGGTV
ncbi:MAG: DUF1269 domain-containing protein [Gemmatimonas sp.]